MCVQHHCPDLHAWWLRLHEAALRACAHDRCADAQRSPAWHAHTLRPRALRARALRGDHTSRYNALLAMCGLANLPCACKRCAYLRPASGCGVLVQALARVQPLSAPRALAPCARTTSPCCLRCARSCPVRANVARVCALSPGAQCLGRYWPRCISTSRCCSSYMDDEVAQLPIIAQVSFVVVISHRS